MSLLTKRILSKPAKFNFRLWLTIIPFLLLLVGLGAAAFLLSSNSDLRQQAAGLNVPYVCTPNQRRCSSDGSAAERCIGGKWSRTVCGQDKACVTADNSPRCVDYKCQNQPFTADMVSFTCSGQSYYGCKNGAYQKQGTCNKGTRCEINSINVATCVTTCGADGTTRCSANGNLEVCRNSNAIIGLEENGWHEKNCPAGKKCAIKAGSVGCF